MDHWVEAAVASCCSRHELLFWEHVRSKEVRGVLQWDVAVREAAGVTGTRATDAGTLLWAPAVQEGAELQ